MSETPMEPWTPWTIVHKSSGQPVLPMDCADDGAPENEALLVFRSEAAARLGAKHQENWEVDAEPCLLSVVIMREACGLPPTEDPLAAAVRDKIYGAQGIGRVAGKIGPAEPGAPR